MTPRLTIFTKTAFRRALPSSGVDETENAAATMSSIVVQSRVADAKSAIGS